MNRSCLAVIFSIIPFFIFGQKNSYRFAATYFGIESEYIQENNSFEFINSKGQLIEARLASSITPRVIIGGTHFWGKADFYISIPTSSIKLKNSDKATISNGVLTGFRLLPFGLKSNSLTAYIGAGFNNKTYRQESHMGETATYSNWQIYKELGMLLYVKPNTLLEIGMRYFSQSSYNSYISRSIFKEVNTSPFSFSLTYKKLFDFTNGYNSINAQKQTKRIIKLAKEQKAMNSVSFGVGLSSLIPFSKTELASRKIFFNDKIEGGLNMDLSAEYYHNAVKASIRVSYRPLKQKEMAHNYFYQLKRNSLAIEGYKFISNYHGFVPFLGVYISHDKYIIKEKDDGINIINHSSNKVGYGIVMGWDIRQTNYDFLTLRTNIRYTPQLNYKFEGFTFTSSHLEFNFIQIVFYPERYKIFKQAS